MKRVVFTNQLGLLITSRHRICPLTKCAAYVVWCGRYKPLIGQHDTETSAGRTQQLLIVLSATDVMWFTWHIVIVDNVNGWVVVSGDCHSHEQKLY